MKSAVYSACLHLRSSKCVRTCLFCVSVCGVLDVGGALHKGRERESESERERSASVINGGLLWDAARRRTQSRPQTDAPTDLSFTWEREGPLLPPAHHPAWLLPLLLLPSYCSPGRERETEKSKCQHNSQYVCWGWQCEACWFCSQSGLCLLFCAVKQGFQTHFNLGALSIASLWRRMCGH